MYAQADVTIDNQQLVAAAPSCLQVKCISHEVKYNMQVQRGTNELRAQQICQLTTS